MKKILAFTLIIAIVVCIGGCTGEKTSINVSVKISEDYDIVNTSFVLAAKEPVASDAIIRACQDEKIAYTLTDGLFDGFGGLKSTKTDGWLFYVNGQLAQMGAKDTPIKDGDVIEFRYENYESAFEL
ncbi:MAG: DUF4430 domain-containing protein [Ruminococcaceae bacterium]|nr:DUF4430 domain-containing protein [Oscillospiraceae bacterium]